MLKIKITLLIEQLIQLLKDETPNLKDPSQNPITFLNNFHEYYLKIYNKSNKKYFKNIFTLNSCLQIAEIVSNNLKN